MFFVIFLLVFPGWSSGHPFGGVLQKTVVSDIGHGLVIEYTTHFGPDIVLTLHPDKNFDGLLDGEEQNIFLDRAVGLLLPNIAVQRGKESFPLRELERKIVLEDPQDYKNGLNTTFVWSVSLRSEAGTDSAESSVHVIDNNFLAGEMNRLNYYVTVLGETGAMRLADEGRELVLDRVGQSWVSDGQVRGPGDPPVSPAVIDNRGEAAGGEEQEAGAVIGFLKDKSGGIGLYLFGLLTAFVLGALHALSPGHGKAMVAAYLVGTRGRIVDAVRLGVVVTITHVISVLVLGIIALIASRYTLSKDFYPWLGVASGALIFITGYFLLARTALVSSAHNHHHDHPHPHQHNHDHGAGGDNSLKELISLGVAGGLVPCPSAIVILLFAVAVGRIATGLLLILSFSLGLAAVLICIGIFTVSASQRLQRLGSGLHWVKKLPIVTAGIIMILGVAIGINALLQAGILTFQL